MGTTAGTQCLAIGADAQDSHSPVWHPDLICSVCGSRCRLDVSVGCFKRGAGGDCVFSHALFPSKGQQILPFIHLITNKRFIYVFNTIIYVMVKIWHLYHFY